MKETKNQPSYTYLLKCHDGSFYCGWTNNIMRRLKNHNVGKGSKYTRTRLPVRLAYIEVFSTKEEAMSREWHIKQLTHAQKKELCDDYREYHGYLEDYLEG